MKICWLENGDIMGGAELFSADMLVHIPEDTSVEVLMGGNNKSVEQKLQLPKLSLTPFYFPSLKPFSFFTFWSFLKSIFLLQKKIREIKPDVVYANTVRTAMVARFAKYFFPRNTKTVYFAHDYTFPQFFGTSFLLSGFSHLFACSYAVKHFLCSYVSASHIDVIENGVDMNIYHDIPPVVHPIRKIGMIGRITPWKGQLTLLHAAYDLKNAHHELPFRFFIFGEPSEKKEDQEYFEHLHHFVEENNLDGIVSFRGFVPSVQAMSEVDLVVHAPNEPEPFGRVPIEAAAARRMLCISQMGTPAQIFEDKKTALFFQPNDALGLAECLRQAYLDAPLGEYCIENAYTMVQDQFSLSLITADFWKTMHKVVLK